MQTARSVRAPVAAQVQAAWPRLSPASCPRRRLLSHACPASPSFPAPRPTSASGLPGRAAAPHTCIVLGSGPGCPCRLQAPSLEGAAPPSGSPRGPRLPVSTPNSGALRGRVRRASPALSARGRLHIDQTKARNRLSLGEGDTGHPVIHTAALFAEQAELFQGGVLPCVLVGVLRGERTSQPGWPPAPPGPGGGGARNRRSTLTEMRMQ